MGAASGRGKRQPFGSLPLTGCAKLPSLPRFLPANVEASSLAKEPKLSKRELVAPDKFQAQSQSYLEWAHAHPKETTLIGVGLLALILVIGLVFGGGESGPKITKSGAQLSEALALLDRPVVAEGEVAPEDGAPSFKSETEKQQAVEKALVEVREQHPGTDAARSALLPLADARFKLGKFDEALKGYDEYLAAAPADDPMRFLALEGRAIALEAKGDLAGALAAWERMGKDAPAEVARALYGQARIQEKQGKWDEARKLYEQIRSEHAQSPMSRFASDRLAVLNVAHPPAAEPANAADAG
jgi:tetratricopeptide (TPR) repeat protein